MFNYSASTQIVRGALDQACESLIDLEHLGPHLRVPMRVKALKQAAIVWLNDRWFLERGVDTHRTQVRRDVTDTLIARYAVSIPSPFDEPGLFVGAESTLWADRYGGTGGAHHGGSGRAGILGGLHAKGVGRTPLAASNVDWEHSHGWLWMHEAIREAINAEIAYAELPHRAVPVIAIIDTGVLVTKGDKVCGRRAIIVRPNFIRPAHFERSIFFGDSGSVVSDQYKDALRTQDAVRAVTDDSAQGNVREHFPGLREMFLSWARQIGAAHAHRLWQGRFLTSNIAVDGALVDFGAFRAVPNWRASYGELEESFGSEIRQIDPAIDSLCFYFRKYARLSPPVDSKQLRQEVREAIAVTFAEECQKVVVGTGGPWAADAPETAVDILRSYFRSQQGESAKVDHPPDWQRPWLFASMCGEQQVSSREQTTADELRNVIESGFGSCSDSKVWAHARLRALCHWLHPRPTLYYRIATDRTRRFVEALGPDMETNSVRIHRYIERMVSSSRRLWPLVPAHLEIVGQTMSSSNSIAYCLNRLTGERYVHLEAPASDHCVYLTSGEIPRDVIEALRPTYSRHSVQLLMRIPGERSFRRADLTARIGKLNIPIPSPRFFFRS